MRAVTGSVVSSKPISLSKAAAVLSRFAANENASRPEVAAFVHRAAAAFDELVLFHREIRAARRRPELEKSLIEEKGKEDERKKKKRKRSGDEAEADDDKTQRAQSNGDIGNADLSGFEAEHGSRGDKGKKRRRKADVEERTELVAETAKNLASVRNLVENGQHYEDAVKLAENEKAGKKKKMKKMMVETEEMSNLDQKREPKPALEEESQRNKKKKDKEKLKRNPKETILEISDKRQINNFGSIGVKDQKEQIMKKKKKHYN